MKYPIVIATTAMALVAHAQVGNFRPYSVSNDFHEVANAKAFTKAIALTPEHRALLKKNLFVVSPSHFDQLYQMYGVNDYQNLPSLVTTDSVLHLYHVFFDGTLRKIERDALLPKLERLTAKMYAASMNQAKSATDDALRQAATRNAAYFAVAANLLKQGSAPTTEAVGTELGRIKAASGFEESAIFPYKVDYSRFIVRGHYTKSEALQRYFRAMTWFGMMPFELADQNGKPQAGQINMAVLAADALKTSGETADWQAIYEPTSLYVGASNMYTPDEIRQASLDSFGSNRPNANKLQAFVNRLREIRSPKITTHLKRAGTPGGEVQFRFMGLRYIPDSEIMQRLTGEPRPMTSGLDVMSVLGSRRATDILDGSPSRYNPNGWGGYQVERSKLNVEFAQVPNATWSSNLYWSWLDTLRLFLKPSPRGYPQFMRNQAWQDKNLSTALASWAELRHDTLLYGEQSVAEQGGDDVVPPYVKGFVEPAPAVYERLIALSKQSRVELQKLKLLDQTGVDGFKSYEKLLGFLDDISAKELAGTPLTKAEHLRIRHIEGTFGDMTETMLLYGANFKSLTEDDWNMALVADVHTGGDLALEEGVGKGDELIAVVPIDGKLYFARGPVFSYFEFTVPISGRLTDEAWKKRITDDKAPGRPHWTSSFFTSKEAKEKE
jgi:hypothetical protein